MRATKFGKLQTDALDLPSDALIGTSQVIVLKSLGTLTATAIKDGWIARHAGTISDIRAGVLTAPTGATLIFDVNKNGVSLFTTQANRPIVAISGVVSSTTDPDIITFAAGDIITFDIDQIGSTVAGANAFLAISVKYTS